MATSTLTPRTSRTVYWRWVCLGKGCDAWHKDDPEQAYGLDQWRRVHEALGHEVVLVPPHADPVADGWRE